jgi:hypothetical protein
MVDSALSLLSDSYGRLASAGVPPGLDAASYLARVRTLQSFAEQAADEFDEDYPTAGAARYTVVKKETRTLLGQINSALGTHLTVP